MCAVGGAVVGGAAERANADQRAVGDERPVGARVAGKPSLCAVGRVAHFVVAQVVLANCRTRAYGAHEPIIVAGASNSALYRLRTGTIARAADRRRRRCERGRDAGKVLVREACGDGRMRERVLSARQVRRRSAHRRRLTTMQRRRLAKRRRCCSASR